jgi:two-component system response regulator CpxR
MRAILRRAKHDREAPVQTPVSKMLRVGDVEMDMGTRLVFRSGERIDLTFVEFSLLEILLSRASQLVAREDLIKTVLGRSPYPYDRSIDVHISRLRKKLGHEISGIERIKTVRNAGYLYVLPTAPESEFAAG